MATKNCSSCADLQDYAPEFVLNGVTDTVAASLKNDTGFNPNNSRNDCTDLNDASDCLIGNMDDEIEAYDVCDWKTYMHNLVPNVYNMFKSFTAAICGLWTNVHSLWTKTNSLECSVNYLYNGKNFSVGEDTTDGSYVVAGKGVSFLQSGTGDLESDIHLTYIAGGLIIGSGTLKLYGTNDFTDAKNCYNFDTNGINPVNTNRRVHNPYFAQTGKSASGGELLYEIRIKNSQYPQIKRLYAGLGHETNGGAYRVVISVFNEGAWAHGQHGTCSSLNGEPSQTGYDHGHQVQPGWTYVQVRLSWADLAFGESGHYTPRYLMGVRMNQDYAEC